MPEKPTDEEIAEQIEKQTYERWLEREKNKDGQEKRTESFLTGQPIPWSEIKSEDNQKDWLWENYIAKGNITLLSALWKAGKSTFLRCLFVAMEQQEEFAGQPTKKSKILVLSEEDKGEWSDKREDLEDDQIDQILVWARPVKMKPNIKQWIELINEVTLRCIKENIDMVVIDTLTTFWPIDNENDSAQVIKALVPLYNLTENGMAVLLVHHFRKGGGDQAQASRGSGALPGFVDNIIEFTRKEDGMYTQRILKTYGRFDNVVPMVVLDYLPDGRYITLGEPWQVSKSGRIDRIIQIFQDSPNPLTTKEVFSVWSAGTPGITIRSIRSYVAELVSYGILSAVNPIVVGKKRIWSYQLSNNYEELRKVHYPPPSIPFRSSSDNLRLSAVFPQLPLAPDSTEERKGTSVVESNHIVEEPISLEQMGEIKRELKRMNSS